ncbi:hypothetical protein [Flavobacterium ginsenosidimutans]|uniref:Uncharacterized protein n=1 Tax=Flavobacterium ginsenosidimutans TaxID=687844 RepID=A0ABZ2QB54_9FLAO|nr:hypothetical protein [Flavobacterium ginsenosidimutans]KAF2329785.1 hypothetical protein DM444_16200 [Flavobacterium ginsenosidimutans]
MSIEQSIELREQISRQEERFAKLVEDKKLEIKQLNLELQEYHKSNPLILEKTLNDTENSTADELFVFTDRIKNNPKELKNMKISFLIFKETILQLTKQM